MKAKKGKAPAKAPPGGYEVGDVLQLQILQTNTDLLPQLDVVSVTISELITCTMATVVRVTFDNGGCAVLKLYDRRWGSGLRESGYEYIPYCDQAQAAFHAFLQRGAMGPFLQELDDEDSTDDVIPRTTSHIRAEPDGVARFEALLWRHANKHFNTETEAYNRMQDLQGVLIPRLYAVVRAIADRENAQDDEYLHTHGILLESIDGHSLDDLITAPCAPKTKHQWFSIVQRAVDSAHEINKRGIILDDSAPRNVVVDQTSHQVFHVDFAQCFFKDTMFNAWCWDTDAED
ncbi:kinase-like domain-containing protein [Fusarium phyllophilum]|uniref:Kinase-like domain-containing protein n=1 Tax=Fusarium phyllophilum TaxID=47803 RepID=A0A8H5MHM4_9HYPO|nr:kinase-like domain-containing protein [Fusarium phyllophilum]